MKKLIASILLLMSFNSFAEITKEEVEKCVAEKQKSFIICQKDCETEIELLKCALELGLEVVEDCRLEEYTEQERRKKRGKQ